MLHNKLLAFFFLYVPFTLPKLRSNSSKGSTVNNDFCEQLCVLCNENPPCFLLLGNPIPAALEEMCGGGKWWDSEEEWLWPSHRWSRFCHAVRESTHSAAPAFSPSPTPPTSPGALEISRLWLTSCSCSSASLQVHTQVSSGEDQGGKGTCVPPESTKLRKVQRSWQTSRVGTRRFYLDYTVRCLKL